MSLPLKFPAPAVDDAAVARDVQVEATQRLMEALVEAENRMARRVQILSEVVFELDPHHRLVFLNNAWCHVTGFPVAGSLGRTLAEFVLPADQSALADLLHGCAPDAGEAFRHYRFQRADRRESWVEVSARLLPDGGAVGVLRDVTERRRQEVERLRAQRLQSTGPLPRGIAHDLNNALSPILMGLDVLRARFPEQAALIDPMLASAGHGAEMVRQVLTFARGGEGQLSEVNILRLVEDIAQILRSSFPRNITIETRCPRGLPRLVGDFTQLHQVLLNLCVNARDAMPDGGQLSIVVSVADVVPGHAGAPAEARAGGAVVLSVTDTGTGIPPEVIERMFEPFFTTKPVDQGTGLGLSTVSGLVRRHGGFVTVRTALGEGSTFRVHLPADAAATELAARPAPELRASRSARGRVILLVEDEVGVREVARLALTELGHDVRLAGDGQTALDMVRSGAEFDVIVTDLDMPRLSGLALVEALRRLVRPLPIVACSGRLAEDEIATLRRLGVAQILAKPFSRDALARAIEDAVSAADATGGVPR